ncbi:MAG: MerR family transcriptional regulator [Bacteroidetes bacterium]|nr:MerR family transcriptional regulator [Bacteroidota bacterium]
MDKKKLLISELAKKTGVSIRTIRYYTEIGLLPPISSKGRYTYYSDEYVTRIRFVQKLKESFLPLKVIRLSIDQITISEMEKILKQDLSVDHISESDSEGLDAASYISNVLDSQKKIIGKKDRSKINFSKTLNSSMAPKGEQPNKYLKFAIHPGIELHILENTEITNQLEISKRIYSILNQFQV